MKTDFTALSSLIAELYPNYSQIRDGVINIGLDSFILTIAKIPGVEDTVLLRTRVLSLNEVKRSGEFALAAASGNFFWGGARGAELSVGPDNALYLTEQRLIDDLGSKDALDDCISDFTLSVSDWKIRSLNYA